MDLKKRIGDLLEERAGLVTEMRGILEKADGEKRDLTAEERQEYDRREARVKEIGDDHRRYQEQQREEERDLRGPELDDVDPPEGERAVGRDSDEYRDAFNAYARGQASSEERSALAVGTDADGGYAVPETWTDLHESLRESGIIRQLATVIQTEKGGALHVPFVAAAATEPGIVPEATLIPDDAETLDEKRIEAYKIARITKASDEVVQDALFDVAGFVGRRLGFDLGRVAGRYYAVGDGVGEPEGLFTGAPVADETALNTAITGNEAIDLYYSVIAPYRANGVFIGHDSTIAALRKEKSSDGQYLWQPSLQAGTPDLFLGKPVYAEPDMPQLGADDRLVLGFGDVKRAYMIRDVLGVTIKYLQERYADTGQVAWRGQLRTGGAVVDEEAFKVLSTPTA